MLRLLEKAAEIAGANCDIKKYYMACIAIRKDGAAVASVNHSASSSIKRIPEHHAEARALRKADFGSILYVARVLRADKKTWAMSRPCPYCQKFIKNRGVIKVYYTIGPNEYGVWNVAQDAFSTKTS